MFISSEFGTHVHTETTNIFSKGYTGFIYCHMRGGYFAVNIIAVNVFSLAFIALSLSRPVELPNRFAS